MGVEIGPHAIAYANLYKCVSYPQDLYEETESLLYAPGRAD